MTKRAFVILAMIVPAAAILLVPTLALAAKEEVYRINVGDANSVCGHAVRALQRVPAAAFSPNEDWRKWFHRGNWTPFSTNLLRHDGSTIPYSFSYTTFDLDNNGREEVILWKRSMMHSAEIDVWYLVSKEELSTVLRDPLPVAVVLNLPAIKTYGDSVSVDTYVPVDFGVWSRDGVNYLVMREFGFPKRRKNAPSTFLVGKYSGQITQGRDGPTAKVDVLCAIAPASS
jgi:hypothetical protein